MATNRLRKRLDEADERTKARANESFCSIGTPLPSLDSKRDANEYKPEWQQEVYDDQGRRRFHGAFTGGFSAGYYNTVGSKEGWTPSSFRSSRKEKQKSKNDGQPAERRRVEDFMDDEDLEDLRQGRGALQSSEAYGGKPHAVPDERDPLLGMLGLAQRSDSASQGTSSHNIQRKTMDNIGTKILQRMGWTPGHGLGPRRSAKRKQELEAALRFKSAEDAVDDAKRDGLVAPPDTKLVEPRPRQDLRGLGWDGSDRPATLAETLQRERGKQATSSGARRGGFGIGALEYDSDGEEEVYAIGHQTELSTMGRNRLKATKEVVQRSIPHNVENQSSDKENTWHDGRPMLAGFRISQRPPTQERWYAAPRPPPGWKPDPQRVWTQAAAAMTARKEGGASANLGPTQRASILGEARMPGPPPMIADYLSLKARERIERAKATASDVASATVAAAPPPSFVQRTIPKLDSATAKAALRGYVPFENELAKQQRYKNYLQSQAEPQSFITLTPDDQQSEEQFHRELNEFSRSAAIFKPMSTMMASRFESSTSGSTHLQPLAPGLHIPDANAQTSQAERDDRSAAKEQKRQGDERAQNEWQGLTAVQRNARMGLFGPETTREVKTWKPARLLCKRFDVPPPYPLDEEESEEKADTAGRQTGEDFDAFGESSGKRPGRSVSGGVNARWEASKRQLQHLAASRAWEGHDKSVPEGNHSNRIARPEEVDNIAETTTTKKKSASDDLANVGLGGEDEAREEAMYVKPPLDLFKAIFADDEVENEQYNGHGAEHRVDDVVHRDSRPLSDPPRIASDATLPRPTFVPRKRAMADDDAGGLRPSSTADDVTKDNATKKVKHRGNHKKAKGRSLLTFAFDDDDDDDDNNSNEIHVGKSRRQQEGSVPDASVSRRPRASDLFD